MPIPTAQAQRTLAGKGIEAQIDGQYIRISAPDKLPQDTLGNLLAHIHQQESLGQTVIVVERDGEAIGMLALRDTLRDDAKEAVAALHALGVQGVILTGDNPRAAAAIAGELGLDFRAGLLPEDKVQAVQALNQRSPLAMVGDGINDAPAMKASTIGIAMGSGTDVALETADAALTHNRLIGIGADDPPGACDARQYPPEHRHGAGVESDLSGDDAAGHDRAVAGGAGGYRRNGAGDGQRVAPVTQQRLVAFTHHVPIRQ